MSDLTAEESASRRALGVPADRIPRSVAIIMDGNGRWARARGLPRPLGHHEGAKRVRAIVTESARLGVEALALYSFSLENWSRPQTEVAALMDIYATYLAQERETFMAHNVRLRHLGRREGLPVRVLQELDETIRLSADNTGMTLCLALNYGSRAEITDAARRIAQRVADGTLLPDQIDDAVIDGHLGTVGLPDTDLLIRTAGEMRVSNFLLWQISYAELYVAEAHWPDFDLEEFRRALRDYAGRDRRFGGVDVSNA